MLAIAAFIATACGGGGSSSASPNQTINTISQPSDILTTLGVAGLGCGTQPTRISAGLARVALCSPIAGIKSAFLTVGMYTSPAIAAREYQKNCTYKGWSLFRQGQNWRAAIGPPGSVPEHVAKRIATAAHTDLHGPCPAQPTPSG